MTCIHGESQCEQRLLWHFSFANSKSRLEVDAQVRSPQSALFLCGVELFSSYSPRIELNRIKSSWAPVRHFKQLVQGRRTLYSILHTTSSNEQRATSNEQPATSNQQPATSNQQPATSNQQPATSNKNQ
jgi:hypothetical protein